jgi:hypothetical protein
MFKDVKEGQQFKFFIGHINPIRQMPVDDLGDFAVIGSFAGGIIQFDGRYFPKLFQYLEIRTGAATYFKHTSPTVSNPASQYTGYDLPASPEPPVVILDIQDGVNQ